MENIIYQKVPILLKKHHIVLANLYDEDIIAKKMTIYIYHLVYNICGLVGAIALLRDKKKEILPTHIKTSLEYVKEKCFKKPKRSGGEAMKGGSYTIDSDYFGRLNDVYNQTSTHTTMSTVNFNDSIARVALPISAGMVGGGSGSSRTIFEEFSIIIKESLPNNEIFPSKYVREVFGSFGVTIKTNSLEIIKQVLKTHLNCFIYDLKKAGKLTEKKLDKVVHMARHSIFL